MLTGTVHIAAGCSFFIGTENKSTGGFILGPYEETAPCCYVDGPSEHSEYELFNGDLDRLMPHIEACMTRVPGFADVGIKTVYNGAIAYTPDGNPIVGPDQRWDYHPGYRQ